MTKKRSSTKSPEPAHAASEMSFFEIVNWKKAQPKLSGRGNTWCKNYTSLLEHDGYASLADGSRNLLHMLWLYAARTGQHILPADSKWLWRQIPILNSEPDLRPLLETKDIYGRPTPFLRLCGPPGPDDSPREDVSHEGGKKRKSPARKPAAAGSNDPLSAEALESLSTRVAGSTGYVTVRATATTLKTGNRRAAEIVKSIVEAGLAGDYVPGKGRPLSRYRKTKTEENRLEKRRLGKNREDPAPYRASDHPEKKRKSLTGFSKEEQTQATADQSSPEQTQATADQSSPEPENPSIPTNSDAEQAKVHHVPRPARSAARGPEQIGAILGRRFKPWWDDEDCEAFAWAIVEALGYSSDRLNLQSRNEWGTVAAWWWQLKQAAPFAIIAELRVKALEKATEIRTKRKRHVNNPGAMWVYIMGKEMVSHGVRLPDERAGPPAANN